MPKDRALLEWIDIDRNGAEPIQSQIDRQLRTAIQDGRLPPGCPLPSSRSLATDLGIARGTVIAAYDRLLGENLLQVRGRSATFVASQLPWLRIPTSRSKEPIAQSARPAGAKYLSDRDCPRYAEFLPGVPAFDMFPASRWTRLLSARCNQMSLDMVGEGAHAGGFKPLRNALTEHLRTSRGVLYEPEQIIVTSSARAALTTACRLVADRGDRCIVEDPGYAIARRVIASCGLELVPVPVDANGISMEPELPDARLAYVTPTHQMPLGVRLANDRCEKLLEWARTKDAWVVEDDYDSEFRYAGQPVAALQQSDPNGRVIHIGTFSKTLFPSLRVAYLIVPMSLAKPAADAVFLSGEPVLHVQAALSDFIAQGHYAAHIRRARLVYRRRQGLLVDAINHHLKEIVTISQPSGGMHVVVPLPPGLPAERVQLAAAAEALYVRPVSYYTARWPAPNSVQLGYAAVPDRRIEPAVSRLARAIHSLRSGPIN